MIDALVQPIKRLQRGIAALAKPDPRVDALRQLPGVGLLTAMTLVAEIGDIGRFGSSRKLCAWAGLTPSNKRVHEKAMKTKTAGHKTLDTARPHGCVNRPDLLFSLHDELSA